jgi:1-acyl-sn-glycerol-3-phosphate acyltransferase
MRHTLQALIEALFRVLFEYDCRGEEHVPATGPAVVAANHPSYLDPILLSLQVPRPIHFMAWDALFRVPLLGAVMRLMGAFPVDIHRGKGREAYERAKSLIAGGEVVGIFPEGRRSHTGWMEPALREGAARLAWETGTRLVPATIAGAFRAWPYFQALPRPARIRVRFHEPIDPTAYRELGEDQALEELLAELRRRVERSLLPAVKADLRIGVLYRMPAPWPRLHEWLPPLALALLVFWKTRTLFTVAPAYAYLGYLLLDYFLLPQRRLLKWLRNGSPVFFLLGFGPVVLGSLGLPSVVAPEALVAMLLGALFPYLYERGNIALGFIRGLTLAAGVELLALVLAPSPLGPHLGLLLFAAAYAWERRTVFWRYAVPVLLAYLVVLVHGVGADLRLLPHVLAGLLSWMIARLMPYRAVAPVPPDPTSGGETGLGLGLLSR